MERKAELNTVVALNRRKIGSGDVGTALLGRTRIDGRSRQVVYKIFNHESFEPYNSNIYVRRTLSGEFTCVNKHLIHKLMELNLWNEEMKNKIVLENGSVQNIAEIPDDIKKIYKTAWEMAIKTQINMCAERGRFVDQSQSFNIFLTNIDDLSRIHFYGWKKGLKTGMYYLRTRPAIDPIKITADPSLTKNSSKTTSCNEDVCVSCHS